VLSLVPVHHRKAAVELRGEPHAFVDIDWFPATIWSNSADKTAPHANGGTPKLRLCCLIGRPAACPALPPCSRENLFSRIKPGGNQDNCFECVPISATVRTEYRDARGDKRGDPMSFTRYGSLKGRTVIITGGASGIGASFVRALVENGAKVAFLDLQRETGAALSDSLVEGAARPLFVPCDLTDTRRSARFARRSVLLRCWSTTLPTTSATSSTRSHRNNSTARCL
jgi:hypothetical protein